MRRILFEQLLTSKPKGTAKIRIDVSFVRLEETFRMVVKDGKTVKQPEYVLKYITESINLLKLLNIKSTKELANFKPEEIKRQAKSKISKFNLKNRVLHVDGIFTSLPVAKKEFTVLVKKTS